MQDIRQCLIEAGVDKKFEEDAIELFNEYYKAIENQIKDPASAIEDASYKTLVVLEGNILQNKRLKLQTMLAKIELEDYLQNSKDPYEALIDIANKRLAYQEKAVMSQLIAPLNEFIVKFKKGALLGTRSNKDFIPLVVKELYNPGVTKNAEAAALAKAYQEASEHSRLLYNQAGGAIPGDIKVWALPQHHHAGKIIAAGLDTWKKFVKPLLSRDEMVDRVTGLPLDDKQLDDVLNQVYKSITQEGRNKLDAITATTFGTGRSIAKRHQEQRVLRFQSGESWLAYHNKFSDSNSYDMMINHLRSMSKDIASLQILGGNPESTVQFLKLKIQQIADKDVQATGDTKSIIRAKKAAQLFDDMWQLHKGIPESVRPQFSKVMRNFNSLIMATRLGSTTLIAAPTDMMTVRKMAKYNGMSQMKAIRGYLNEIMRLAPGEREKLAAELGLLNEHMMDGTSSALARYLHEDNASPFFQFITDSSLRLNGLTHITVSGRRWSGMMLMSGWADVQSKSYADLSAQMKVALGRYDITEQDWNTIRKAKAFTKQFASRDVAYLRGEDIANIPNLKMGEARKLADKYTRMIFAEVEVGVPTVNLKERAKLSGTTRPGEIPGEITRSFAMFKSWPMAFYHNHLERAWKEAGESTLGHKKLLAIADTVVYMTLMGALGVQLMEITKGRTPMEMNPLEDPEAARRFWGNALVRSGGFGPLFDVAMGFADYRQGLSGYVAGPVIGSLDTIGYALFGSAKDVVEGEPSKAGTRILSEVIRNLPYQSNWMINLMLRRMVWEKVLLWNDPAYAKKLEAGIRRDAREYKEYWWRPGDNAAPDVFN